MPLSQKPFMRHICAGFGSLFIAFGINAMLRPESALSFFELTYPTLASQRKLADVLLAAYGYRDVFMGLSIFAAAYCGTVQSLGLIMLAAASVAAVDGWACYALVGSGQGNHWGYAPWLVIMGAILALGF
ncbi:putative integral membrane protein [Jaminaea rosea]|uniref:Putative integral membrane protein n=1 Tax=Jaminaea rosea TaxID=1569628 RepID=A0A316UNK6_9BASI|nr:putative integral membrane protein [Jaminaea rosea]PWN24745.1 putative integral membrane protein [Jaminaea rosea]